MNTRTKRIRLQDNPQLKMLVSNIPLNFAENQPDLTTGLRIGDLAKEEKFAARLIAHYCRTLIFARNINNGLVDQLKLQNCPIEGEQ